MATPFVPCLADLIFLLQLGLESEISSSEGVLVTKIASFGMSITTAMSPRIMRLGELPHFSRFRSLFSVLVHYYINT